MSAWFLDTELSTCFISDGFYKTLSPLCTNDNINNNNNNKTKCIFSWSLVVLSVAISDCRLHWINVSVRERVWLDHSFK